MSSSLKLFVDVAGWCSFLDREAAHHQAAVAFVRRAARQPKCLTTTNLVLGELFTSLACQHTMSRGRLVAIIDTLKQSSLVEIVHIDPTLEATAWQLLRSHPEQPWSLVDTTSFAVMRARKLTRALTTSPHFSQAGFTRLLV